VALGKRAVYFTVLSIVFVTVLFSLYTFKVPQPKRNNSFLLETRIFTMNQVLEDVRDDAGRFLSVATFRALVAMEDSMALNGTYIGNTTSAFQTLIVNGTLNGINQSVMQNNTYPIWQQRMLVQASNVGVTMTLTATNLTLGQLDPWTIAGQMDLVLYLNDPIINATYNTTVHLNGTVGIQDFEDPTYRLNTAGRVTNTVQPTPYTTFVSGSDVSNLQAHMNNTYYRPWTGAPDLLQRFEGKLTSSSQNGIESLVNLQQLSDNGIGIQAKSAVDYIYFSASNPTACTVQGMPSWFYLDTQSNGANATHKTFYQVSSVINPPC
jgi:hypothetical protein